MTIIAIISCCLFGWFIIGFITNCLIWKFLYDPDYKERIIYNDEFEGTSLIIIIAGLISFIMFLYEIYLRNKK